MNQQQQQLINRLLSNGYEFHTSQYIKKGFDIFKKNPWSFIGFMLVLFGISLFSSVIPVVGPFAYYFILGPVLGVGYYIVAHKMLHNEATEFGDFFKGFDHIAQLVLLNLVMIGILLLVFSPTIYTVYESGLVEWYMAVLENPLDPPTDLPPFENLNGTLIFLNFLPALYLMVAYIWSNLFVVFHGMNFWEALESSRQVITKKWFSVFGLFLSMIGIAFMFVLPGAFLMALSPVLGGIIYGLSILVLIAIIPAFSCMIYVSFADVTNLGEDNQEEDILDHLIE